MGIGSSFDTTGVPENGFRVFGITRLDTLGIAGTTQLCQNATGEIASCSSSARYKTDVIELELGLAAVLALEPVAYRWTANDREDIGFVAEEVAAVDERLITRNADGEIEGVRYDRITALLANAAQQMNEVDRQTEIELQTLRSENAELRAQLAHQGDQLARLERQQDEQLATLRAELELMRELLAPRLAQETHR
ncbi:MAG: tail fiber domain-containing protein [Pseudomonadota bacterium]